MPIPVSADVLAAKKQGFRCSLIKIEASTPLYITDNAWNVTYDGNTYLANGLLQNVEVGNMTAGVNANDWDIEISAVDQSIYTSLLAQNLQNRWVTHYVAYLKEDANGLSVVGVEQRKRGQILSIVDADDEKTASATITLSGPLGNVEKNNALYTNNISQQRRWGNDDYIFTHAHETDLVIPNSTNFGGAGTPISNLPTYVQR